jgi:hypothetical protein
MVFRCAAASLARDEPRAGTASTVRSFLLVENAGPWGADALQNSRLPEHVKTGLRKVSARTGVRVLLIRRHRRVAAGPGIRVFAARADPASPWLETTTVASPEVLLDLDVDALGAGRSPGLTPADGPLFCVCTHGRHDACCAERGRPTAAALATSHPEETWEVSHIGGDRFAPNLLVLPDGLYYGGVTAADAPGLASGHLLGHLDLDHLRGRTSFPFAVQAAEVAVRSEARETRIDAVRLVSSRRHDAETVLVLDVAGTSYDVVVRRGSTRERHQLTCQAAHTHPIPTFDVVSINKRL